MEFQKSLRKQSIVAFIRPIVFLFILVFLAVPIRGQYIDNDRIFQDLQSDSKLDVHVEEVLNNNEKIINDNNVDKEDVEEEILQDAESDKIMNNIIDSVKDDNLTDSKPVESESKEKESINTKSPTEKPNEPPGDLELREKNSENTHKVPSINPPPSSSLADRLPNTLNSKPTSKPKIPPKGVEDIKTFLQLMPTGIDWVRSYLTHYYDKIEKPTKCVNDTKRLLNSFLDGEKWAIVFIDASGKPGTALTKGWLEIVGNYDLCVDHTRAPSKIVIMNGKESLVSGFGGDYFRLNFVIDSPNFPNVQLHIGLCLPDSCSEKEVKNRGSDIIQYYGMEKESKDRNSDRDENKNSDRNKRSENSETKTTDDDKENKQKTTQIQSITLNSAECLSCGTDVTKATVIAIVLLSILVILAIAGTTYDIIFIQAPKSVEMNGVSSHPISNGTSLNHSADKDSNTNNYESITSSQNQNGGSHLSNCEHGEVEKSQSIIEKLFVSFSFYTNANKVLSVSEASGSLGPIHGIRFLTMCWVILGHTYLFSLFYCINVAEAMESYFDRLTFVTIWNAFPSVDSFFAISGLLMSYTTMTQLNKKGWRLNWPRFYFHRFWRLTPPYMAVLVISLGLTQYLGSGPLWSSRQPFDKPYCEDNWWKNLLFINNFKNLFETCVPHSWYLANDMQFFMITPLLVVPFYFSHLAGLVVNGVLLLTCWITTGVLSTVHEWHTGPVSRDYTPDDFREWVEDFYSLPYNRIGPYIVGIVAGYYLTRFQEISKSGVTIRLKKWMVVLGWTLSTITALSIIYGIFGDITGDHKSSVGVAALYNAVSHTIWGLMICWIVLACHMGYGGPINTFLSWSPFVVLGKLTFMVYLLHPYIIMIVYQNLGMPFFANDSTMVIFYLGFLLLSHIFAFIFMLLLESPMVGLEKIFLPEKRENKGG